MTAPPEEPWYVPIPAERRVSAWRCSLSCSHEAVWHTSARDPDAPEVLWCIVCHLSRAVTTRAPQPLEYGACPLGHEVVITAAARARGDRTVLCGDCWWAAHPDSITPMRYPNAQTPG